MSGENKFMDYFYEMAKMEEDVPELLSYQGVDNNDNKAGDFNLEFSEDKKDINLVIKQENKESADKVNILKEDSEGMKEFKYDLKDDFSTSSDSQDEMEEKISKKNGSSRLYKSIFTVNVESNLYSLKNFKSKYTCKLCNENFQYNSQLSKHFNAHQNGFKCDSCPRVYTQKSKMSTHVLTHVKKFSVCCYCNLSFDEDELLKHLPTHFEDDEFENDCSDGNSSKSHTASKSDEMEPQHGDSNSTNGEITDDFSVESKSLEEIRFNCDKCDKSFKLRFDLRRHMIHKHDYQAVPANLNSSNETEDRYYCDHCESSFRYPRDLFRHMNQKHEDEETVADSNFIKHECPTCLKKFRFPSQLETHKTFFHLNLAKFICNLCGRCYEHPRFLTKHFKLAHKNQSTVVHKTYKCNICRVKFNNLPNLNKHKKAHEKSRYNCNKCDRSYKYPSDLKRHMRENHNDQLPVENEFNCDSSLNYKSDLSKQMNDSHNDQTQEKSRFYCNKCDRSYKYPSDLKRHIRENHNDQLPVENEFNCDSSLNYKSDLSKQMNDSHNDQAQEKSRFYCNKCDRSYKYPSDLKRHIRENHNDQLPVENEFNCDSSLNDQSHVKSRFYCEKCDRSYKYEFDLRRHMRDSHNDQPVSPEFDFKNKCEECGKKFEFLRGLKKHSSTHVKQFDKKRKCNVCKKKFLNKHVFKVHLKTHFNERPFKCDICNTLFKHKSSVRVHKRLLHMVNEVSSNQESDQKIENKTLLYQCNICKATFSDISVLDQHVKRHTDFKCEKRNDKSFPSEESLRNHIKRQHSRKYCFTCEICGRQIRHKHNIKRHLKLHEDEI